jgi:hypothetical protein
MTRSTVQGDVHRKIFKDVFATLGTKRRSANLIITQNKQLNVEHCQVEKYTSHGV